MIAVNLTESQVAAIAGASAEIAVRLPNGHTIGYFKLMFPVDSPPSLLAPEQEQELLRRMATPIEETITTDELVKRFEDRVRELKDRGEG